MESHKPPSILFINRVFPPTSGATGQLLADLVRRLPEYGWETRVLTTQAGSALPFHEEYHGVGIYRVKGLNFSRKTLLRRALGYLSLYPSLLRAAACLPKADLVVTMTDPPLQSALIHRLRKISKGSRFIHWAQDLYPEVAAELKVIRHGGLLARCLTSVSTRALMAHDALISVGRCMAERLVHRGIARDRIHIVPNWALPSTPSDGKAFRMEHALEDKFVVMYSGNLGLAHSFTEIIQAADTLRSLCPTIIFVFVGEGPQLGWVKQQCEARNLCNIRFLAPQPTQKLGELLSAADVHVVTMKPELWGVVVPSKIYGVLHAGKPCLFVGPDNSEAASLLANSDAGRVIANGDSQGVANLLESWSQGSGDFSRVREAAARHQGGFLGKSAAKRLDEIFRSVVESPRIHAPIGQAMGF